jgi:hypothetical protein
MKKQAFISITALLLVCIFWSCDDNTTNGSSQGTKLSRGLDGLFADQIQQATQKFTINADRLPAKITGKYGTTLTFLALTERFSNRAIRGDVQVEFIEIYTVADMLLLNKPTVGLLNGQSAPLESGGEFYVSAKQNDQVLTINYNIVTPPSMQVVAGMQGFTAQAIDTMPTAQVLWRQSSTRPVTCLDSGGAKIGTYCLNFQTTSWCNIDQYWATDTTKPLIVVPPAGLNWSDMKVYLTVVGVKSLVPLNYSFNSSNIFSAWYGLKLGTEINIIVVADDKGTLKYAIQRTKITNNQTETISTLTPITVDELRNKILAL